MISGSGNTPLQMLRDDYIGIIDISTYPHKLKSTITVSKLQSPTDFFDAMFCLLFGLAHTM